MMSADDGHGVAVSDGVRWMLWCCLHMLEALTDDDDLALLRW